jgi:hypothetical protein
MTAFADYVLERKLQGSPDNDGGLLTLSSPTTLVGAGDDGTTAYPVALGFTFNFNDVAYTSVNVFVDGVACFGGTECASGNSHPHGEFDDAKNLISLHPWNAQVRTAYNTGYVKYELQGAAPNRKMVIEWRVHTSNNQSSVNNQTISYQVILEEGTDNIQFRYGSSSITGSVTGFFAPKNAVIGARIDTTGVINGNIREFTELTGTPDPNGGVSTTPVELTVQALTEYPGSDSNGIESAAFNFHFNATVEGGDWSDYGEETELKFGSSFTINKNTNFSKNHKFSSDNELRQAPFSLTTPGPVSLRGRTTPYKNET